MRWTEICNSTPWITRSYLEPNWAVSLRCSSNHSLDPLHVRSLLWGLKPEGVLTINTNELWRQKDNIYLCVAHLPFEEDFSRGLGAGSLCEASPVNLPPCEWLWAVAVPQDPVGPWTGPVGFLWGDFPHDAGCCYWVVQGKSWWRAMLDGALSSIWLVHREPHEWFAECTMQKCFVLTCWLPGWAGGGLLTAIYQWAQ